MDWKAILQEEYNKNNQLSHIDFLDKYESIIGGENRGAKRKRVYRALSNLRRFGTTINPNTPNVSKVQKAFATATTNKIDTNIKESASVVNSSFRDGKYISDRIIEVAKGTLITPEIIMEAHKIDPSVWEVISYNNNFWQSLQKDSGVVELYQSKVVVKPKSNKELTIDDIDTLLSTKTFNNLIKYPQLNYNNTDEFLEIDIADLHCGLLSWREETGSDYDLHICAEKFLAGIDDIVSRAKFKHFSEVYFCALGDILHIDNDNNTTTKGTYQQADGRLAKIFDFAFDTMNTALNKLRELNIPIHYIYTCGNHDRTMGYALVRLLQVANNDVIFDTKPNPQKAIHSGNVLVGLSHGDMPKYNKGTWLMNDYRKEFGNSHFVEEHCGHIHTEEAKTYNGIMVRSVMAQCGNSYWEHQQGYRSERGIMSFVWNKNTGLRETWYYYY